jgi:hypothetical protein
MPSLSRSIDVEIRQNIYNVKFPNSGELMDIDLLKLQITNGRYDSLKFSLNPSFQAQALKVDAVAFFNTMLPKLRTDLAVKSIFDLDEDQMLVIVKAFEDTVLPWFEEWQTVLATPVSKEETKEEVK